MAKRRAPAKAGHGSVDEWILEYEALYPTYQQYVERLKQLLEQLLSAHGVPYHAIEARAKTVASFGEKLQRPGKGYENPVSEILDLAGLRIILYYVDDASGVSDIIDTEFEVDAENSMDKFEVLAPDQFGYLSIHKVVRLSKTRRAMTEWRAYDGLLAEIQVRTVLQHAWASISHRLQYKRETEVPVGIRRKLIRLSGLLELADEEFSEIQAAIQTTKEDIAARIEANDATLLLDLDSLTTYLTDDPLPKAIFDAVAATGFKLRSAEASGTSQLLRVCEIVKISSIGELSAALSDLKGSFTEFFTVLKREWGSHMSGSLGHWTAVCLVGKNQGKTITVEDVPWSATDYTEAIFRAGSSVFGKKTK